MYSTIYSKERNWLLKHESCKHPADFCVMDSPREKGSPVALIPQPLLPREKGSRIEVPLLLSRAGGGEGFRVRAIHQRGDNLFCQGGFADACHANNGDDASPLLEAFYQCCCLCFPSGKGRWVVGGELRGG